MLKHAIVTLTLCWALSISCAAQPERGSPNQATSHTPSHQAISENGAGKHALQGVKVPFNPGLRDKDDKVIPAHPNTERFEGIEEGPGMTQKGLEDKARAERGEFSKISKPLPRRVAPGKSNFLQRLPQGVAGPGKRGNSFKIEESTQETPVLEAPFLGNNFSGISDTGTEPPDVASAAGPFQIVASSNFIFNTFDKNGNLQSSQDFESFFSPLGNPATWFLFDPVVQYDPYIGRFWFVVTARNDSTGQADLLIAMSQDSDLRFGWSMWFVDITQDGSNPSSNWCDYPHLGLDTNAIYMTCNQFNFSDVFQYTKIRMMLKAQFLNNTCCQWFDHWNIHEGSNNGLAFTIQPAMMRQAAGNSGEFLIDAQGEGGSGSTLEVYHIPDPVNNPAELDKSSINTTGYSPAPSAQQPSGVTGLDTGDARLLYATYEAGHLSAGQNSNCGSNSCAAFYEIDVSNFPSLSVVNDWAFQASGVDYYYPAVDQNSAADKTMVYTRSSPTEFAGSKYVGIPNSGVCTLCFSGPETSLASGQDTYSRVFNNKNRWGDYFTASADPDGLGVWISGENVASLDTWATQIAATYNNYAPFASLSSAPLDLGNQPLFTVDGVLPEVITNTGNATLLLGSVTVTGDPDISIIFDGCSFALLQPHAGCETLVRLSPSTLGRHSATFAAPYNDTFQVDTNVTGVGVQVGTATSIAGSPNPSTVGQPVTFAATVASQTTGIPPGNVIFKNGTSTLGTAALNGGSASLTTNKLGGGSHTITATYAGSTLYLASSAATTQTVNGAATSTTLTSSLNPSTFGQTVTFTASVSSKVAGTIPGSVAFIDGATTLATVPVSGGKATFSTAQLKAGMHSITARYKGSPNFAASTSKLVSEQVNKVNTTTTLKSSGNPATHGTAVTFTATVTPAVAGNPSGTVTFKDGATVIGTAGVAPATHQAKITKSNLAVGTHIITAVYSGANNFVTSTSAPLEQVIK